MAALDIDDCVQNVKTMLKNLSAWQTILGVSTAADAAEHIHEYGVEDSDDDPATPCIILDVEDLPTRWQAGELAGSLTVQMRLELEIPEANRDTYSTQGRWFWQKLSALLAGINGGVNDGGELMLDGVSMLLKPGRIEPDTNNGRTDWMCILGLEVHLR